MHVYNKIVIHIFVGVELDQQVTDGSLDTEEDGVRRLFTYEFLFLLHNKMCLLFICISTSIFAYILKMLPMEIAAKHFIFI
jgi:hypothetical protein